MADMGDYYKTSATYPEPTYIGSRGRKTTPSSGSSVDPQQPYDTTSGYETPVRKGSSKQTYVPKPKLSHQSESSYSQMTRPAPVNPKLRRRCQGCENVLRSLLPLILLIFYTLFGAMLFHLVEKAYETDSQMTATRDEFWRGNALIHKPEAVQLNERVTEIVIDRNYTRARRKREVRRAIIWYLDKMGEKWRGSAQYRRMKELEGRTHWDFVGSLFYSFSLYTTIGYGNPGAATTAGQVLTVFYSLIGIPLAVITLIQLAYLLGCLLLKAWSRLRHGSSRRSVEPEWNTLRKTNVEIQLQEQRDDLDALSFPLSLVFLLVFLWMLLTAALYYAWEKPKWSYGESLYFTFISFATIGLGDYKPWTGWGKVLGAVLLFIGLLLLATILAIFLFQLEALHRALKRAVDAEYRRALDAGEPIASDPLEIDDALKRMSSRLPFGSRCIYWLMPGCRKASLRRYYRNKAALLNRGMQTDDYLWAMSAANARVLKTIGEEESAYEDAKSRDDVNSLVAMCDYSLPSYKGTLAEF